MRLRVVLPGRSLTTTAVRLVAVLERSERDQAGGQVTGALKAYWLTSISTVDEATVRRAR